MLRFIVVKLVNGLLGVVGISNSKDQLVGLGLLEKPLYSFEALSLYC